MWNLVPLIVGGVSAYMGSRSGRNAESQQRMATAQAQKEYDERAPFRNLGMQTLGNVEGAIDMGNHSYNPTNPFAAARGPSRSIAEAGNWGQNTFQAPMETPETQELARRGTFIQESQRRMRGNDNAQRVLGRVEAARQQQLGALPTNQRPGNVTYGWNR